MILVNEGLFLPALMLALIAFAVPRLLAGVLPEGVRPLLLNAFLSTILLCLITGGFFFCLYLWQGLSVARIMAPGLAANVVFFGRLGLIAGLIWAPVMVLSVAGLPGKWVEETW